MRRVSGVVNLAWHFNAGNEQCASSRVASATVELPLRGDSTIADATRELSSSCFRALNRTAKFKLPLARQETNWAKKLLAELRYDFQRQAG